MSNFRVGQKVVCVDVSYDSKGRPPKLKLKAIYTYRGPARYAGILLNETEANDEQYGFGFWPSRFRPLITPEQDIALFHALCPGLPVVPPAVVPKRVPVPSPSD